MGKILVSMPDELIEKIDATVSRRGVTRSAFLQGAARRALAEPDETRIRDAVARARDALSGLGQIDSGDLIRNERDARDTADRRR